MEILHSMNPTVKQLADLAREANIVDPIDWGLLNTTEEHVYELMASNVLEQMSGIPEDQRLVVSMATVTKLLVENFVLNIKLQAK
jgi:hypothetical protein